MSDKGAVDLQHRSKAPDDDDYGPWVTAPTVKFKLANGNTVEYRYLYVGELDEYPNLFYRYLNSHHGDDGWKVSYDGKEPWSGWLDLAAGIGMRHVQLRPAQDEPVNAAAEPEPERKLSDFQQGFESGYELGWRHAAEKFQTSMGGPR